jgi:asparagine synthase (glutamine-hydrolysing)
MCGVAGIFNLNGEAISPVVLRRMTNTLAHRGPDGEGFFIDSFIGLGHRRLAIIDLSPGGHQPMTTPDGRYSISYNGEIYNFADIKRELESRGRRFQSRSDTEVLLQALAEWGADALPRLNGMFAFALWDRKNCELTLARDRYGVKPLYYALRGRRLLFASEVKAILADESMKAEMDEAALVEYLSFQNFFTDRTLFKGVKMLPAATWLRIKLGDERTGEPQRYWDYSFSEPERPQSEAAYERDVEDLFRQAVKRQLLSDVPVSAFLSGGMDTGSITAVAAEAIPDLKSFTIGFDKHSASGLELGFDEREAAEYMSYLFKTEHYEMVLKAGDMERCLPRLVWHLEEPRVGQSYPNYYAAQLAGKFGKVVLAGSGGDEIFAGYPWRYYRAVTNTDFDDYVSKYFASWQRLVPPGPFETLIAPIRREAGNISPRDIFESVFPSGASALRRPEDYINHSLYFEAKTFLHGILVVEDKLSMAHSLESRVPFLDNDLVDYGMKIPAGMLLNNLQEVVRLDENVPGDKTRQYFEKTQDGKAVLRRALSRVLPERITQGIKQGFSGPDARWFRGESIDYVREMLLSRNARIYDFIDYDTAHTLIEDHLDGRQNRRLLIWSLLYLEHWCATFLASGGPAQMAARTDIDAHAL